MLNPMISTAIGAFQGPQETVQSAQEGVGGTGSCRAVSAPPAAGTDRADAVHMAYQHQASPSSWSSASPPAVPCFARALAPKITANRPAVASARIATPAYATLAGA